MNALKRYRPKPAGAPASGEWHVASSCQAVGMAFLIVLLHSMFAVSAGPIAYALLAFITLLASLMFPTLALALIVVSTLFQSMCLGLSMTFVSSVENFQMAQATNFFIPCCILLFIGFGVPGRWRHLHRDVRAVIVLAVATILLTILYSAIGMGRASSTSVLTYLRVYWIGSISLILGILLSTRMTASSFYSIILTTSVALGAYGLIEFTFPEFLYNATNTDQFMNYKFAGKLYFPDVSRVIANSTRNYLNLSGHYGLDLNVLRILGPNIHSISYGYALAFACIVAFINRHYWLMLLCALPLLVVGAKGALLLVAMSLAIAAIRAATGSAILEIGALTGMLAVYVVGALIYGYLSRDYHFVGLMGGIKGFLHNPIGYGVGVGGNMSDLAKSTLKNFQTFQHLKSATFALESALGVLFYQMGVCGAVVIWLWVKVIRLLRQRGTVDGIAYESTATSVLLPTALTVVLTTSLFQEETFSPAGWGMWMLLAGFYIGKLRLAPAQQMVLSPRAALRPTYSRPAQMRPRFARHGTPLFISQGSKR